MAFSSSTVSIGNSTKKENYDVILANTQYNKSALPTHSGTTSIHTPITISTATASGGSNGDVWFVREA